MFDQALPGAELERLSTLLVSMAASLKKPVTTLTEQQLTAPTVDRFTVITSAKFSACLQAIQTDQPAVFQTRLTFAPATIADFLHQLQQTSPDHKQVAQAIAQLSSKPNDGGLQSQFTLELLTLLSSQLLPATCQPAVEAAMEQQIKQERLLNQVTTQIRQSLDLPVILKTAVEQGRAFLQVDRLLLFQFFQSVNQDPAAETDWQFQGRITYQALASEQISSVLDISDGCWFDQSQSSRESYRQGKIVVVENIYHHYQHSPCLLDLLSQSQVQAKLVVPIIVQDQLWGLLIAHQCDRPRQWQPHEQKFLRRISEHLAIAIYQAQLYAQVQQQKQTLEQRVVERTQALQEALRSVQSANRVKSDFLATMSHELRTPLTCVIGMSATLLRWSLGPLSDKQRSYIKTIHDSGEHLLELINDILDLSQVEAGKTTLNVSEFSLAQVARQSIRVVRDKAQQAEVELKSQIQIPDAGDRFVADQRRLRQILLNLLTNAIKFTPAGGKVTLRVWREANTAIFQVEDTGIGIPTSQQPLLFRKFQQLDSSYKRSYEGMGLGLALTKQLVDLHQGWIGVESAEGKGSVFTVELPIQSLPLANPILEQSQLPMAAAGRIILIEAQEESANLICDILTAAGYQVIWMIDPATAVQQIQLLQPLAVISALDLPSMDGYEILRRLRQHPLTNEIKIIALTSSLLPEEQQELLAIGANSYLTRPIDPEHLLYKVSAVLAAAPS
ncbi:MAG: GAF domain-containing protein [Aphanocapsa sp. GSE-SYN-MK-11-07L]|nr:GAF domain-containing protein [Aphanocapsa sp. GSE-SYN-MK-11-07L]